MTLFTSMIFGETSVQVPGPETFCNQCRTRVDAKFVAHLFDVRADSRFTNSQTGCRRGRGLAVGEQQQHLSFPGAQRLPGVRRLAALGIKHADHHPIYGGAADVMTFATQLELIMLGNNPCRMLIARVRTRGDTAIVRHHGACRRHPSNIFPLPAPSCVGQFCSGR